MDYIHYTEEEFVRDTYFQKWILNPDHSTRVFWDNWILEHPEKEDILKNATYLLLLVHFKDTEELADEEVNNLWQNILQERKKTDNQPAGPEMSFHISSQRLLKFAAVLVGLIGTTFGLYFLASDTEGNGTQVTHSQITLQLEDGSVQVLDESAFGVITNDKGEKVVKQERNTLVYAQKEMGNTASEAYNELQVPYGKKFELILSDGSHVFLNSGSKLKYPVAFADDRPRNVYLDGEAYFSVAKDQSRPFTVVTDKMNTRVYGTKFNVSNYSNENKTETVLVEGSVSVYKVQDKDQQAARIVPGQRAVLTEETIAFDQVDVNKHIAWTEGKLLFIDDRFDVIIKELERHFNITIDNQIDQLNNKHFTGTFTKESLNQILRVFQEHTPFDFRIHGTTITINQNEQ